VQNAEDEMAHQLGRARVGRIKEALADYADGARTRDARVHVK
jgi:hypothetical protein